MSQNTVQLKTVVLSQDRPFTQLLKILLSQVGVGRMEVVRSTTALRTKYALTETDVCLLDVSKTEEIATAVEIADGLRQIASSKPLIFVVDSQDITLYHVLKKFTQCVVLHKDLSAVKLLQAYEQVGLHLRINELTRQVGDSVLNDRKPDQSEMNIAQPPSQLFFRVGDNYRKMEVDDILFFYAEDNSIYARVENRNFPTSISLSSLEQRLRPKFLRCHKKYLVNVSKIDSILLKDGKIKVGDQLLSIGYHYRKKFLGQLHLIK